MDLEKTYGGGMYAADPVQLSGDPLPGSVYDDLLGSDQMQRVTDADIMPPGEKLPPGIKEEIEDAIYTFMAYECKPPLEDMSKARAGRWSACCMYIGQTVVKKYLRPKGERDIHARYLPLDTDLVISLAPLWAFLCQLYEKIPLEYDFFYFCGCSYTWIYADCGEEVTREKNKILQVLHVLQEKSLSTFISDGTRNPTGALAILNHCHGWHKESTVVHNVTMTSISAADLPKLPQI